MPLEERIREFSKNDDISNGVNDEYDEDGFLSL